MERTACISSNIISIGYDTEKEILEVEFKGGGIYQFLDVLLNIYEEFIFSNSKGKFFSQNIKNQYTTIKVN